ncbi:hypothetical protein BDW42DRAFT_160300 [Aspergillus taichungensis]|uniref:Zn(2)-C6 fungal-type domain-containing protein n=1 Tax=Aspergillus taichungensis TaxID=482145 RepID=A0A2J5I724_9EURO|nr:hypothetical protein BDW42DRAFT_160300 [Aspergillus taichungensis]
MYRRQPPRRYACRRCVQLKVKCIPAPGSCQRCRRLGHPSCVFPVNVRGNNTETSHPRPSTPEHDDGNGTMFHEAIDCQLANKLLFKYRAQKMSQFPFVIVPPELDLESLRQQSPFLLLCILTASSEHDPSLQHALEAVVRQEVASRLIVKVERNMDLLQGLLVHAAWYHYHWRTYHTHMYMLLQMAASVVADLALDRQESFGMQDIPTEGRENDLWRTHKAAGQRALLGCYYLCSKSSTFRRQVNMQHTTWIDRCAETLGTKKELSTDVQLTKYIEIQLLARRGRLLLGEERKGPGQAPIANWGRIIATVEKYQARTKDMMRSFNENRDWPLLIEGGAVPVLVYGQALGRQEDVFKLQDLGLLGALTESAHRVIDIFLSVPSTDVVHLPAPIFATIWYALLCLSKLSLFFHPSEHQGIGLDKTTIHSRGVAIIRIFEELSLGDDVWRSSKNVVGNMLAWLNRTNVKTQPGLVSPNQQPTSSIGGRDKALQSSLPGAEHLDPQPAQSPTHAPDQVATTNIQFPPYEVDASVWQQMLDSFAWVDPLLEIDSHEV